MAHSARRGPTAVNMVLASPSDVCPEGGQVSVAAFVKGDATRMFKLQNKAATQQQVGMRNIQHT